MKINFSDVNCSCTPIGQRVLVQMYYENKEKLSNLISLDGELLNEKYGKLVFNIAKIVAISDEAMLETGLQVNDVVSLQDEWIEAAPDFSAGFNPTTGEPKKFVMLGKLIPFFFKLDKFSEERQDEMLFLVPTSIIAVKYNEDFADNI